MRSSVARRLGMDIGGLKPADRHVEGVVEMMLDATQRYDQPLAAERLFGWHASLFPDGSERDASRSRSARGVTTAPAPMQVVSGPVGRERVHFEAPAAERLDEEMRRFLEWFNGDATTEPVLKAALAHLWFVTIHPFDDGNGRIARAIADMALAQVGGKLAAVLQHVGADPARSAATTTASSSRRSEGRWTSRRGWSGSSVVSLARLTVHRLRSRA